MGRRRGGQRAQTERQHRTGTATQAGAACEGRQGDIRFSGRLEVAPDQAELSMVLDSAPDP